MACPCGSQGSSWGREWSGTRSHLAEWPGEAPGAVTAEAVHQVLTKATMAGAAGALVQLELTVPSSKAPWAHTLVAVHQVLESGKGCQ